MMKLKLKKKNLKNLTLDTQIIPKNITDKIIGGGAENNSNAPVITEPGTTPTRTLEQI